MFQSNHDLWPNGRMYGMRALQPPGGVAPLRHDLALAEYIRRQAEFRATESRVGSPSAAPAKALARPFISLCLALAEVRFHRAGGPIA